MKKTIFLLGVLILTSCTRPKKVESEYLLLETMGYYQRFSEKLWLAGINQNWELAGFYSHELEEVTEEFIKQKVNHDGHNLSELVAVTIEPSIEGIEDAIEQKDEVLFLKNYKVIIASCNACHVATGHSFIKIKVPDLINRFNQAF